MKDRKDEERDRETRGEEGGRRGAKHTLACSRKDEDDYY